MDKQGKIEEVIIDELQKGPQSIVTLVGKLGTRRPGTTKQGVYRSIRKLNKEEHIVVYKKKAALNYLWVQSMERFFALAGHYYAQRNVSGNDFLFLQEGERVSYSFHTLQALDQFWVHAAALLIGIIDKAVPVLFYNPHEWFLLARPESERQLFADLKKEGRSLFVTVGNEDPLDKVIRGEFDGTLLQYVLDPTVPFKSNQYMNIFGDFILETALDKKVTAIIDAFYKREKEMTPKNAAFMASLLQSKGNHKLTISKNAKKAQMLRRKLGKHFVIPKESRGYFS